MRISSLQNTQVEKSNKLRIAINGKFLGSSSGRSGVYRVAYEIIHAIDALLSADPALASTLDFCVILPNNAVVDTDLKSIRLIKSTGLFSKVNGNAWEQTALPWLARKNVLLSLCNIGPIAFKNAYTMMHDAQVHAFPMSYSRAFRLWYRFAQPWLAKINRRVLTVSDYSRQELELYGVASKDHIAVIHNGCDHVLRVEADRTIVERNELTAKSYVVALSNTQAHKNIGVLLQAFQLEPMRNRVLVLFGSAGRSDFEKLGYSVPSNVKFIGRINDSELYGLLSEAMALAFPSLTEGFGLPPLEAMVLGCPVVIAPCGALLEVCGAAALRADPHDALAWANQISRLYDDPEYAACVAANGLEHAKLFTWKKAALKLIKIISSEKIFPSLSVSH
jgi:glycosyltransferase involved in cell wall biosynthesis